MPILLTILTLERRINFISEETPLLVSQSLILSSDLFILRLLLRTHLLLVLWLFNLICIIFIDLSFLPFLFPTFRVCLALLFEILVAFQEFAMWQDYVWVSSCTQI